MKQLQADNFFDLSSYEHKELFDNCAYVWMALTHIKGYLEKASLGSIEGTVSPQAYLVNIDQISIGEGSVIEPGAYIEGPCIIGKRCIVRHGAYVRGFVITGDDCVIGHDTEIKNSILLNHTKAPHFAYVGDSILGNNVNLGAGTKCANLKLDSLPVVVFWNGERINTTLRKFGAIVGDNTQIGCNSVTNPGALIGKDVLCYPCTNVNGYVPSNSIVKPNNTNIILPKK